MLPATKDSTDWLVGAGEQDRFPAAPQAASGEDLAQYVSGQRVPAPRHVATFMPSRNSSIWAYKKYTEIDG